jgi:hypothetical protein
MSSNDVFESITYHPLTKWTNYKRPLLANAQAKLERLDALNLRSKT